MRLVMAKHFFDKYLPTPDQLKSMGLVRVLGDQIHNPNLWHLNRRSAAGAMFVGVFAALLPMPFQSVVAALGALWFHKNLPVSVACVWLSNPFTMAPLFYLDYRLGTLFLDADAQPLPDNLSVEWLLHEANQYWQPILLGSVLAGLLLGAISYVLTRILWRWYIIYRWNKRKKLRQKRQRN